MWEVFLDKKIVVYKISGHVKYGVLTGIEKNFIFLKFDNDVFVTLAKDEIKDIKLDKKKVESVGCY